MNPSTRLYRVRFRLWTDYAIDIAAPASAEAIDLVKAIFQKRGRRPFDHMNEGTDDWAAEEHHPCEPALPLLKKAIEGLNTAPRFRVGNSDSYVIAAELGRLIRDIEGASS